ncbi:MAG: Cu(I)-responsive transcriptional regulator [Paracoccaceae bacterium]|jgi:Cu(I)-responsive transcriptional regulator|nr:Cu(I)-responsive transcriptional regulator [Paracoccaceae bacterium]|tara:strand:- start:287 stop:670 length:384 start_codon:yes stop_codon:yes gene_type:complete
MNIGKAADQAGLPTKTVRYYADIGLVLPSSRTQTGYRNYDISSIKKLIFVKRARSFDFSIKECRELLGLYEEKNRSSSDVRKIAIHHLEEIKRKEEDLKKLRIELDHLVNACAGDDRPDCPIIDYLS